MGLSQCLGTTEAPSIGRNLKFLLLQWRGLCDVENKSSHRNIVVHLRLSFILIERHCRVRRVMSGARGTLVCREEAGEEECAVKKTKFSERKGEHGKTRVLQAEELRDSRRKWLVSSPATPLESSRMGPGRRSSNLTILLFSFGKRVTVGCRGRGLRKWLSTVSGSHMYRVGDSVSEQKVGRDSECGQLFRKPGLLPPAVDFSS